MGGLGTSSQSQTQQSQTQPWQPAIPYLQSILGSAQGMLPGVGLNGAQTNALGQISQNSYNNSAWSSPLVDKSTYNLLAGGGALKQAPAIQAAFKQYQANTNPLANNTDYNPYNTPGFADALKTANSDITNQIQGSFAGAGRLGSGMDTQALARGLTQGDAQMIAAQYNNNRDAQQAAAANIYQAGNANAGLLAGLQQQYLANQSAGVNQVAPGLAAKNAGANDIWNAQTAAQQLPYQNLGMLSGIGTSIAGLGNQTQGSSQGTYTASPIADFAGIMGGFGGFMKGLRG